ENSPAPDVLTPGRGGEPGHAAGLLEQSDRRQRLPREVPPRGAVPPDNALHSPPRRRGGGAELLQPVPRQSTLAAKLLRRPYGLAVLPLSAPGGCGHGGIDEGGGRQPHPRFPADRCPESRPDLARQASGRTGAVLSAGGGHDPAGGLVLG